MDVNRARDLYLSASWLYTQRKVRETGALLECLHCCALSPAQRASERAEGPGVGRRIDGNKDKKAECVKTKSTLVREVNALYYGVYFFSGSL